MSLRKQFEGQEGYHSVEEDVSVGDGMKQTFYTDAYVEWLEALAKTQSEEIDILRTTKKWDKEYADVMELVEKREMDRRDKTITIQAQELEEQASKIADLVIYIESNEHCKIGVTAKRCHCEEAKQELETLKRRVGEADKVKFRHDDGREIVDTMWGADVDDSKVYALVELKEDE